MSKLVSLQKISSLEDVEHLKQLLQKLLQPFGGVEKYVTKGQTVLLKPNWVAGYHYTTGATTNPYLTLALVELCQQVNPKKIIIADGSSVGVNTFDVIRDTGYEKIFAEKTARGEVEFIDLKNGPFVEEYIPGGIELNKIKIPEVVTETDVLINLPVIKTHDSLPVTLGLKNIKGVISEGMKKQFHRMGLTQAILDLNKVVSTDLTIYDGTVGMEGLGPVHGEPANLRLIMAARDMVAGDLVAPSVMGFERDELRFIQLAEQQGMGVASWSEIKLTGIDIDKVKISFDRHSINTDYYDEMGLTIHDRGSCSGCKHTLDSTIKSIENLTGDLEGKSVYLGPQKEILSAEKDDVLIGNCLTKHNKKGLFIRGCPPHPDDLKAKLRSEES